MAIVYKSLEKIISEQDWYIENRAYRPQLVAYTFSKFVYEVEKLNLKIDYKSIWDRQGILQSMKNELARLSKYSFDVIYGPREISNISTYCKSKTCWDRLKEVKVTLDDTVIKECLISNEDRTIDMTRAKKEQRSTNNMTYAIEAFKKGEAYWQNLIDKATIQRALNLHDIELLEAAKKSCRTGKIVSDKQAQVIEKIVEQLKKVGIE